MWAPVLFQSEQNVTGNGLRHTSGPVRSNLPPVTSMFIIPMKYRPTKVGKKNPTDGTNFLFIFIDPNVRGCSFNIWYAQSLSKKDT